MTSTISFITTTFNDSKYLFRLLRSIDASTQYKHECIIVEDGSTDLKSRNAFDQLQPASEKQTINKIRVSNKGLAEARNIGLNERNGEITRFVDADDYLTVGGTDRLIQRMNESNSDIAIGDYFLWTESQERITWPARNNSNISILEWNNLPGYWERVFTIPIHSAIFRNLTVDFQNGMRSKEDWVFWSKVSRGSFPELIEVPVCGYVLHGSNMTSVRDLRSALYWLEAFLAVRKNSTPLIAQHEKALIGHFLKVYWDRVPVNEKDAFRNRETIGTESEQFLKTILEVLNV